MMMAERNPNTRYLIEIRGSNGAPTRLGDGAYAHTSMLTGWVKARTDGVLNYDHTLPVALWLTREAAEAAVADGELRNGQQYRIRAARGHDLDNGKMVGLSKADLRGVNFYGADLSDADLSGSDLRDAQLGRANLNGADFSGADLTGVSLIGLKVPKVHNLYTEIWERLKDHPDLLETVGRSGLIVEAAGGMGHLLAEKFGVYTAAALIAVKSCPNLHGVAPDWCSPDDVMQEIERLAGLEA
jgi:hypothetical protein